MKFLIDAQLPRRLVSHLKDAGHDVVHTLDLPSKNRTTDEELDAVSVREYRIVATKDAGFVNSFLLTRKPFKVLFISTGNIKNADLERLLVPQISAITTAFEIYDYIELTRTALVFHV